MLEQESEGKAGICSGPLIGENTQSYKGLGNIGRVSFILSPHWQKKKSFQGLTRYKIKH